MFQVADIEQSGIPIVSLIYEDQSECFRQAALLEGSPLLRYVSVSRTLQGPEDVDRFLPEVFNHLTRTLTAEEKQSGGNYTVNQDRIFFEGTLEEAEKIYMETERHPALRNAPIARYTDGLPIVVPTEERVAEMLDSVDYSTAETILENLEQDDPDMVKKTRAMMFGFEDLILVNNFGIHCALKAIDDGDLALALKDANEELKFKVVINMTEKAQKLLEKKIRRMKRVQASDVHLAQQRIVTVVRRLKDTGEVIIADRGGEREVIV